MGILWLKKRLSIQQKEVIEGLIDLAILYVQKTMPFGDPAEKLRQAVDAFVALAQRYNITLDSEHIVYLIEARLKVLKDELKDTWYGEDAAVQSTRNVYTHHVYVIDKE